MSFALNYSKWAKIKAISRPTIQMAMSGGILVLRNGLLLPRRNRPRGFLRGVRSIPELIMSRKKLETIKRWPPQPMIRGRRRAQERYPDYSELQKVQNPKAEARVYRMKWRLILRMIITKMCFLKMRKMRGI